MRRFLIPVVLAATAAPATAGPHVEVTADLAAGTGAETAPDTAATGITTASAALGAGLVRDRVPLAERGLRFVPPDGSSGVWLFTGVDSDDRDAIRADVSALSLASASGDPLVLGAGASARGAGWQLDAHVAYQPVGGLRDVFWRSGRGVTATTVGFEEPPAFAFGDAADGILSFGSVRFAYTARSRGGASAGADVDAHVRFLRWQGQAGSVDVFDLVDTEFDGPTHTTGDTRTNAQATDLGVDVAAVTWRPQPSLELSARGGFEDVRPMGTYTQVADGTMITGTFTGPKTTQPRYWVEAAEHLAAYTLGAGAGSWTRLDPTGQAADAGQLATATVGWTHARVALHGDVQVGRLRRVRLGAFAPATTAPVGTRMAMGRGTLEADVKIMRRLFVASSAWLERSDRDDPRWAVPATGALATHAGADVSAQWRFR